MKQVLIVSALLLIGGCCAKKKAAEVPPPPPSSQTGAQNAPASPDMARTARVVLYRTRTDLRDHVPVMLADDGKSILSYPAPTDLRTAHGLTTPVELGQGWLLDRRGVGLNTAFLGMTYADYAAMKEPPPLADMLADIIDRDPITDLCDCGPRSSFGDPIRELQELIHSGTLDTRCKRLK
ncbi:MAG: hypothetical protein J5I62_02345 [Flavobacteriales bacterium]|nr:hypothetical protein [Flavobacteriales bacterium]MEB2340987.1 hypothetical protein [Flavobacteriia bacterium]